MDERSIRRITAIAIAALILAIAGAAACFIQLKAISGLMPAVQESAAEEEIYTLYIGLNDADTQTQLISDEEAMQIVRDTALRLNRGYTMYMAEGGWQEADGTRYSEHSIVCMLTSADEATVRAIMDELLIRLNQHAILVQRSGAYSEYYSGAAQ